MNKMIFVNLPVKDLARSVAFYRAIGAEEDLHMRDERAAMMNFSAEIHVMLLTEARFAEFTTKGKVDAHKDCQVLVCLSEASRADVERTMEKALAAGAKADPSPIQDYGFMYGRSFEDPDGHVFEIMWMDPAAAMAAAQGQA